MEQKEIIEGNKLIAEFMGVLKKDGDHLHLWVKKVEDLIGEPVSTDICELCLKFKYHSSWDWLMPVVEKIEAFDCEHTDCRLTIKRYECKMYFNTVGMVYEWSNGGTSKINSVWLSIIRFIKWYNQTHP